MHKCKNKPKFDTTIQYVYIIIAKRIYARAFYGGYQNHETRIGTADGEGRWIDIRRFDVNLQILHPSTIEKEMFASQLIDYYRLQIPIPDLSELSSYSDIKAKIIGIARGIILKQIKEKL